MWLRKKKGSTWFECEGVRVMGWHWGPTQAASRSWGGQSRRPCLILCSTPFIQINFIFSPPLSPLHYYAFSLAKKLIPNQFHKITPSNLLFFKTDIIYNYTLIIGIMKPEVFKNILQILIISLIKQFRLT